MLLKSERKTPSMKSNSMKLGSNLSQSIKYQTEVSDSRDGRESLLIHISCLLDETTANIVICKAGPQPTHLKTKHSQCYAGNEGRFVTGSGATCRDLAGSEVTYQGLSRAVKVALLTD